MAEITDSQMLDWLDNWMQEHQYYQDLVLHSDEEDGVWFARLERVNCGQLRGSIALEHSDPPPQTARGALRAAILAGQSAKALRSRADCPECRAAKRHAYSDATTPGFFYTTCEAHRKAAGE
jgi:hypothetical protein